MITQTARWLRVAILCLVGLVAAEGQGLAQNELRPERGGFTLLLNLGLGIQDDSFFDESAVGLAGLNVGAGGFLTEDLALMFRISGTNVTYDRFGDQVSGAVGATLQYWVSDRFNVEAGPGMGFWTLGGG